MTGQPRTRRTTPKPLLTISSTLWPTARSSRLFLCASEQLAHLGPPEPAGGLEPPNPCLQDLAHVSCLAWLTCENTTASSPFEWFVRSMCDTSVHCWPLLTIPRHDRQTAGVHDVSIPPPCRRCRAIEGVGLLGGALTSSLFQVPHFAQPYARTCRCALTGSFGRWARNGQPPGRCGAGSAVGGGGRSAAWGSGRRRGWS